MTTVRTPSSRPRPWLALGVVLAAIGIAVLWPLQQVGQVCILIYPAPPGCGADEPRWVPLVAIGTVIAALLAAAVVVYFTVPRPRTVVILLDAAIVVVVLIGFAVVALSQTGIWDPYYPPVMTD